MCGVIPAHLARGRKPFPVASPSKDHGRRDGIAIFSFSMRSVGRSTHAARTAGAHIRYITRPDAQAEVIGARMPIERKAARRWLVRGVSGVVRCATREVAGGVSWRKGVARS